MKKNLSLVLLAAGNSRRFGGNKLLEPVDGKPMYLHIVDEIEREEQKGEPLFSQKIVVTQYEAIVNTMEKKGYCIIQNPHSERGISSSVRLGLLQAEKEDGICFAVCDQPYLKGQTIRRFLEGWENSGKGMGCVGFCGRTGNPAVFSKMYFEELMRLEGDTGGKKVIAMYPKDVYIYEAEDKKELEDIDSRRKL